MKYTDLQIILEKNRIYEYQNKLKNKRLFNRSNSLVGYWFQEDFLLLKKSEIITNFTINHNAFEILRTQCESLLDNVNSLDCITLHVRGTDYSVDWQLPLKYYIMSLDQFEEQNVKKLIVITDDIDYSRNLCHPLEKSYQIQYVSNSTNNDFLLLKLSKQLIIANSTFSWWAAYLNTSAEKIISPMQWVPGTSPEKQLHYKPIIPNNWTEIDY